MDDSTWVPSPTASRKVTPAFTLDGIGTYALKKASDTDTGSQLEIVTALLMCALTMEAALNAVGAHLFLEASDEPRVWDAVERLSPRKKLEVLAERSGLVLDFGSAPFQDFAPMFKYRDELVHAKTFQLESDQVVFDMLEIKFDDVPELQAPWEKHSTAENAKVWRQSVHAMTDALCQACGCTNPIHVGYPWSVQV